MQKQQTQKTKTVGGVFGTITFWCMNEMRVFFYTCLASVICLTIFSAVLSTSLHIRAASFGVFAIFATGLPFIYNWTLDTQFQTQVKLISNYFLRKLCIFQI